VVLRYYSVTVLACSKGHGNVAECNGSIPPDEPHKCYNYTTVAFEKIKMTCLHRYVQTIQNALHMGARGVDTSLHSQV